MNKFREENLSTDDVTVRHDTRNIIKRKRRNIRLTKMLDLQENMQNENNVPTNKVTFNNTPISDLPVDSDSSCQSDIIIRKRVCKSAQVENCPISIKDINNKNEEVKNICIMSNNTCIMNNTEQSEFNLEQESELIQNDEILQNESDVTQGVIELNDSFKFVFNQKIEFYKIDNSCYVLLKHPSKLYFNGKITVTPVIGRVEILGHSINKCVPVFSPQGHSFLCIESIKSKRIKNEIVKLISSGVNLPFLKKVQKMESEFSIIKLDYCDDSTSQFLKLYISQKLYPNKVNYVGKFFPIKKILKCDFYAKSYQADLFNKSQEWKDISKMLQSIQVQRTIVYGGKNVGKSTFLRYLTNRVLKKIDKILYIDLDLGQSEFCVPGCVSATIIETPVLGPNFTQLRKPEMSIFIGEVDISLCVERYLKAIKHLIDYCHNNENFKTIPWLINTMGYTKYFGVDIAVSVIKFIQPTHLIQIISEKSHRNFHDILQSDYVNDYSSEIILHSGENESLDYATYIMNSLITVEGNIKWVMQASQKREMMILAYFSKLFKFKNVTKLTDICPYRCSLKNIKLVHTNLEVTDPSVFNAKLVALCEEILTSNDIWNCIGFGIIRGIDLLTNDIYLLTPLTQNELVNVNNIVLGNMPLPSCIYLKTKSIDYIPYVSTITNYHTTKIPKRHRINPKCVLKKHA